MIEDVLNCLGDSVMWLLFSEQGRQWMPFIIFFTTLWTASICVWMWTTRRSD